ncbi:MAG: hypothetical protein WC291_04255 [Thermodesulfovibrionales bacterium]
MPAQIGEVSEREKFFFQSGPFFQFRSPGGTRDEVFNDYVCLGTAAKGHIDPHTLIHSYVDEAHLNNLYGRSLQ